MDEDVTLGVNLKSVIHALGKFMIHQGVNKFKWGTVMTTNSALTYKVTHTFLKMSQKHRDADHWNALNQQSPTFLAQGTGFGEDNFSMYQGAGVVSG